MFESGIIRSQIPKHKTPDDLWGNGFWWGWRVEYIFFLNWYKFATESFPLKDRPTITHIYTLFPRTEIPVLRLFRGGTDRQKWDSHYFLLYSFPWHTGTCMVSQLCHNHQHGHGNYTWKNNRWSQKLEHKKNICAKTYYTVTKSILCIT